MKKASRLPFPRRSARRPVRRYLRLARPDLRRLPIAAGAALVLSVLLSLQFLPDKVSLRIGDRSPSEIRAARSVTFVDTGATQQLREVAARRVARVYSRDASALAQAIQSVGDAFARALRVRDDDALPAARAKRERLEMEIGWLLTPEQIRYLLECSPQTADRLERQGIRIVGDAMAREIRSDTDDLVHARADLRPAARKLAAEPIEAGLLETLAGRSVRANLVLDRGRTERLREQARVAVRPVLGQVRAGEPLIRRDEVFTQQHLDKCKALGLVNPQLGPATVLAIVGLSVVLVATVWLFLRGYRPDIYAQPSRLALAALLLVCGVSGLKLFGALLGLPLSNVQFGYLGLMIATAVAMLAAVLVDRSLAILIAALLAVLAGLIMGHEVRFCVLTLMSSLVGIHSVTRIRERSHLLRASLNITAANVTMVWVLAGLLGDSARETLTVTVWAVLSALLAVPIFWLGVAVLEKAFGILTHVWLLELSTSEHPLLRELCVTAPGTYAHSIMVGNLAEAGAEAIGADTLFCRVASYYHDIGKMRRPHCFVENQRAENIHDRLNPSLSALIISSHVREGMELADEHRLPAQIKAIIAEHHGTSLIRYFYHQALAEHGGPSGDPILEQHFRYDGPRPQSRESGIIMLADCVEAAARCLVKPSAGRVQTLIESIFGEKLADGQLDECDLTYKDIRKVRAAFVRVLTAMMHGRVDYPEPIADGPRPGAMRGIARGLEHAGGHSELAAASREHAALAAVRSSDLER